MIGDISPLLTDHVDAREHVPTLLEIVTKLFVSSKPISPNGFRKFNAVVIYVTPFKYLLDINRMCKLKCLLKFLFSTGEYINIGHSADIKTLHLTPHITLKMNQRIRAGFEKLVTRENGQKIIKFLSFIIAAKSFLLALIPILLSHLLTILILSTGGLSFGKEID